MAWQDIITVLILPSLVIGIKYLDRRSEKRQKATREFNGLILKGFEVMGDVSIANSKSILDGKSESTDREIREAVTSYQSFRTEIESFKNKQTSTTL